MLLPSDNMLRSWKSQGYNHNKELIQAQELNKTEISYLHSFLSHIIYVSPEQVSVWKIGQMQL